jgi:large subunit ribosomal protein L9
MKVILSTDVPNLGEEGDVREVKRGYARNFLMPRSLALPYNKQSIAVIESRRVAIEKRKEEKRQHAQTLKDRIEEMVLDLKMPAGENGRLFGAVTSAAIADELSKHEVSIERKRIDIPEHTIKASGTYRVRIRLYGNEEASLRVQVNQSEKTAENAAPAAKTDTVAAAPATTTETAPETVPETAAAAVPETEEEAVDDGSEE